MLPRLSPDGNLFDATGRAFGHLQPLGPGLKSGPRAWQGQASRALKTLATTNAQARPSGVPDGNHNTVRG